MRHRLIIIFILLVGCHKHEIEPETNTICTDCIFGKWELINGVRIIGNDTINSFKNGVLTEFWWGVPDYQYNSYLTLEFQVDSFIYDEFVDKWPDVNDNIFKYQANWEWLNTNYSNTHLKLPIRFHPNATFNILKIIELSQNKLEVEYHRDFLNNGGYYLRYEFSKINNNINNEVLESRVKQNPDQILGSWELVEFLDRTNDSVYSDYKKDTLTIRYIYNPGWPFHAELVEHKYLYSLSITIDELGDFYANEIKNIDELHTFGYWYWTDEMNPHQNIYIEPIIINYILDFELQSISYSTLELYTERQLYSGDTESFYYKFNRKK